MVACANEQEEIMSSILICFLIKHLLFFAFEAPNWVKSSPHDQKPTDIPYTYD